MHRSMLEKINTVPRSLRDSVIRSKAEYRRLGKSGLRISNPILGGLHLGTSRFLPWILDEDKALDLLKKAYDYGINTWDTANAYSNGESERIMGKALKKFRIPRQKVVIMTKCYRVVCDPENFDPGAAVTLHHETADMSKDYVNQWGLSRSAIFKAVESSLERLDTDYIDVFQIHRYDTTVPPEETMRALDDLVRSGVVRYIGASSMWTYQFQTLQNIAERNGWTKFITMQNHYNLLYREEERETIPYCHLNGVGVINWAPLASGLLARDPTETVSSKRSSVCSQGSIYEKGDHHVPGIVSRVHDIAVKRDWPMSHVSLAWLNRRTTAPIIGFSSAERIVEALGARGKELTLEEEQYLEELYIPRFVQGHS